MNRKNKIKRGVVITLYNKNSIPKYETRRRRHQRPTELCLSRLQLGGRLLQVADIKPSFQ